MNGFIVELENRPGELARLSEAIAGKGINLTSVSATTVGDRGAVALMTNDEAGTRAALRDGNFSFREIEAVPVSLEDRPGALAEVARRLANSGVNIEALLVTALGGGKVSIALLTADPARTRSLVGATTPTGA